LFFKISSNEDLVTLDKLHYWKSQGHRIILTTATDMNHRNKLLQTLKEFQIPYDDLLLGLPPGPRFVINDRKPYIPYYCMAEGFVIDRDHGIGDIDLPKNAPLIVKQLIRYGGSQKLFIFKNFIIAVLCVRKQKNEHFERI